MFTKWKNSPQKKHSITSLIINFNFQKKKIRLIMISKIELKNFQINLMLEVFVCLKWELLGLSF
jgi:hypothetical protein